LNPARANSFARPYLKKTNLKKRAGGVAQAEGHEFKPQCHKKKKKRRRRGRESKYNIQGICSRKTTVKIIELLVRRKGKLETEGRVHFKNYAKR
jgi:hypothetical protein